MKHVALFTVALLPAVASAGLIPVSPTDLGLYDTGLTAVNSADPHWNWDNAGTFVDAYRITPHSAWDSTSPGDWIWITPTPSSGSPAPIGTWTFALTFDLTGYIPSQTTISGQLGSDNGSELSLAGGPIAGTGLTGGGFKSLRDFTISGGFVSGVNTLLIDLTNVDNGLPWSGNPGGLKLRFTGVETMAIPEPSVLLGLLTVSSLGLLFLRRQR